MPFGIALAGGGARGAAHVGVLLALKERGLVPDSVAGTSAGGIVAGLYASGVGTEELREIVLKLAKDGYSLMDPDCSGIITLIPELLLHRDKALSGLLKGGRLEKALRKLSAGKAMRDASLKIVIPAVDLNTGNTVAFTDSLSGVTPIRRVRWRSDVLLCEAMRATSSLPAVFRPKAIGDLCLVDGGVADVLPVDLLIAAGEKNVLAVDVSEDYRMPDSFNLIDVAFHSLSITQTRLRECVVHGERFLLRPDLPDSAGLFTFDAMPDFMEAGYRAAKRVMPTLERLFG